MILFFSSEQDCYLTCIAVTEEQRETIRENALKCFKRYTNVSKRCHDNRTSSSCHFIVVYFITYFTTILGCKPNSSCKLVLYNILSRIFVSFNLGNNTALKGVEVANKILIQS